MTRVPAFRKQLITWYQRVRRDLPWRRTRDPFRIWISEIMLQQTRVAAVIPYYERFLARFPDIKALASASEQDVLANWAGLGYYSRARNLQKAAKQMPDGDFPSTHEAIRALPGIGDYTAAAVGSIAYGLPHAVVDGNVLRVLTRLANDASDIASPRVRKRLSEEAQRLLDPSDPGEYNQALMELGATVCTPKAPVCGDCPAQRWCEAYRAGTQNQLPVKLRSKKNVELEVTLLLIERSGKILLRQRPASSGQLAGFWEIPTTTDLEHAHSSKLIGSFMHQITFRRYCYSVKIASVRSIDLSGYCWTDIDRLPSLPLTTATRKALLLRYSLSKK